MFSMAYNYMLLFIFVSSSSQNLNNDLWSQSQGYAANKVARVMFKSFYFFKMKKKKSVLWNWRFSCKDEGINIEKENPIPKGHLLYLWKQPPDPLHGLLPAPALSLGRGRSSHPSIDRGSHRSRHEMLDNNKELRLLLNFGRNQISSVRFGNVRNPVTNFISW